MQELHPLLAEPFDADVRTMLSGLKDFSPKPWPQRFREIQAAGGHVEIVQSRIQQGELIAVAAGTLGLTASGRLDGELQMTVAGIEKVIPALGIEKMLDEGVPQATLDRVAPGVKTQDLNNLFGALDRAIPGLGKVVKQNANVGVAAGINALGKEAVLEGKKARAFPLRFVDGAVFLGPLKVGEDSAAVFLTRRPCDSGDSVPHHARRSVIGVRCTRECDRRIKPALSRVNGTHIGARR